MNVISAPVAATARRVGGELDQREAEDAGTGAEGEAAAAGDDDAEREAARAASGDSANAPPRRT